ncbi:MAG: mandelate racemase/muconate lactonizing protein [Chloroflexi bacterium]|nr:mandelate racemase/muconate lactonizing protein [Chloroflexota bacterium]
MKITNVKLRKVSGVLETEGTLWEERLVMPLDIYPEYRNGGTHGGENQIDENHYRVDAAFVQIETDDGVIGIGGPIPDHHAYIIANSLAPIIMGKDPTATELLWDQMHRSQVHGRQGETMMAISAVDCALWDLKGRWLNQPVYRLLGGPTRSSIPAYASMLGFDVLDAGKVAARSQEFQAKGYRAQKWFFRHGPQSGVEGIKKNVELVRTLRESLGEDDDIMLDAWQSWDYQYTMRMAEEISEYRPRWLEEVAMPDRIDTYAQVRASVPFPLSGAEHEYTRWGFKRFIETGALDVLQPDIYWAGGISEVTKIAAYASVYDLSVIPHGHSTNAGIHFSASQSPATTWIQEYLVKWNQIHQFFLADPVTPVNGVIHIPDHVGIGMDLDPAKIDTEIELKF